MADPARLDALRQQFAVNPRRYFAPLASALRRAGDAPAAVALTRAQLAESPEHLTGHVVLGQALADTGDRDGARAAFERAHAVDPGNTVALEALVTIARRAGDDRAAARWVALLREADPEHPAAAAPPEPAFEPLELDAFGADDREAFDVGTLEPAAEVFGPPAFEPPAFEPPAFSAAADAAPAPGGATPNGTATDEAPDVGAAFGDPPGDPPDDLLDPVVGLDVPPADPVPAPMREALPELLAVDGADGDMPDGDMPGGDVTDGAASGLDLAADDAPPPPAAPFVTETMAGLLLAQGHAAQAFDVYAQLLAQRPGDARLQARVAALRAAAPAGAADRPGATVGAPAEAPVPAPGEASSVDTRDERAARMWRVAFAAVPADHAPADDPDEDLARFNAWLRGLGE